MPLTAIAEEDFRRLVKFIHQYYGIDLSQKRQLVTSRLSSFVSQKGYRDFGPFVTALLKEKNPADMEAVLNRLTTNYTFFMRETEHFEFFKSTVLPELVRRHQKAHLYHSGDCIGSDGHCDRAVKSCALQSGGQCGDSICRHQCRRCRIFCRPDIAKGHQ